MTHSHTVSAPIRSVLFDLIEVVRVEVSVDESHINSIRFSNLDETVAAMFPLIQPAIEDIAEQVYETQSLDDISLPEDTPYTSQMILDAIKEAVDKAAVE